MADLNLASLYESASRLTSTADDRCRMTSFAVGQAVNCCWKALLLNYDAAQISCLIAMMIVEAETQLREEDDKARSQRKPKKKAKVKPLSKKRKR